MVSKNTLHLVERRDGKMILLRSHDDASVARIGTALLNIIDRDATISYQQLEIADEADFAGLGRKEHRQIGVELAKLLRLPAGEAERVAGALDKVF